MNSCRAYYFTENAPLSSPSPERLRAWRLFFETALALIDLLDNDFEQDSGFPVQWYDVLVHIEDAPEGLRMNDIAGRILYSKSGLTRVVDRMEKAGLVRRVVPETTAVQSLWSRPTRAARR